MSTALGYVVALLQAALALLGFAQANPTLPQAQHDQAVQVAQQAITTATNAIASSSVSSKSGMPTYMNTQYGFSFDYPNGSSVATINYGSLHPYKSAPVAFVYVDQHTVSGKLDADAAYLTVNASSNSEDVNNCSVPGKIHNIFNDPNYVNPVYVTPRNTSSVTIDGITFAESDYGAPNQAGLERNYSTVHGGRCYDIQIITIPSCSLCTSGPEPTSHHYNALKNLDAFAHTFQFTDSNPSVAVLGMSKYTDADFGFSFWYPSGWTVEGNGTGGAGGPGTAYGDGVVRKWFDVGNGKVRLTIREVYSPTRSVSMNSAKVGMQTFYFDVSAHTWMVSGDSITPSPMAADVSVNTMGGLHMLLWGGTFGQNYLVPLSAHNFVYISGNGDIESKYLINTILATDPSVATPVTAAEQIKTVQAERDALR